MPVKIFVGIAPDMCSKVANIAAMVYIYNSIYELILLILAAAATLSQSFFFSKCARENVRIRA